jgi:hypothetical protein
MVIFLSRRLFAVKITILNSIIERNATGTRSLLLLKGTQIQFVGESMMIGNTSTNFADFTRGQNSAVEMSHVMFHENILTETGLSFQNGSELVVSNSSTANNYAVNGSSSEAK